MLPISLHWTICHGWLAAEATNPVVTAAPTMPPTMECVVDTGQPLMVAKSSHTAAPTSADIMM